MAGYRTGRIVVAVLAAALVATACQQSPATTSTVPDTTTSSAVAPAPTTTTTSTTTPTTTTPLPIRVPAPWPEPRCTFGIPQPSRWDVFGDDKDDTDEWRFSTPEEQGMDSDVLYAGWPGETRPDSFIRSLLVIRNDTIVAEGYFNERATFESGDIYSASKSVISALVGIAIREGHIESLDQRVAEFFPGLFASLDDPAKSQVTLRHLLTMTGGLGSENTPGYMEVYTRYDWIKGIWEFPLVAEPGEAFNYNTGLTHTLSAIISTASGMSTCDFASEYLFEPLGITPELWTNDPANYFVGGSGIFITPREMAKFGLLYLHEGRWNGEQIIPAEWVAESTRTSVSGAMGDYGYLWWPERIGGYEVFGAHGMGGRAILVIPELDLVVVTTGAGDPHDPATTQSFWLPAFVQGQVIPSITDQ